MIKEIYCETCKKVTKHNWTNTFPIGMKKVLLWKCEYGDHGTATEE